MKRSTLLGAVAAFLLGVTPAFASPENFHYFSFLTDPKFSSSERTSLWIVLVVAFCGLAYAGLLMRQVLAADKGTKKMQEIAAAIRFILDAPSMTGQMIALDGGQHLAWQTPDIGDGRG